MEKYYAFPLMLFVPIEPGVEYKPELIESLVQGLLVPLTNSRVRIPEDVEPREIHVSSTGDLPVTMREAFRSTGRPSAATDDRRKRKQEFMDNLPDEYKDLIRRRMNTPASRWPEKDDMKSIAVLAREMGLYAHTTCIPDIISALRKHALNYGIKN